MLDKKLLEILACPICKGELKYQKEPEELSGKDDRVGISGTRWNPSYA